MTPRPPLSSPPRHPSPPPRSFPGPADGRPSPPQWEAALRPVLAHLEEILRRLGDAPAGGKTHFTVREVADCVGRSEYRVRAWIKEGRVQAVKVPGVGPRSRWLIPRDEFQKLLPAGTPAR